MTTAAQTAIPRTMAQCCCWLVAVLCCNCSRKANPGQATGGPIVSASSALRSPPPVRQQVACQAHGTSYSLGPVDGARATDADGDLEDDNEGAADLPFGVTLGTAKSHPGGYVVSAIDARRGGSHAVLALMDRGVTRGRILDLGRVYGDAEPPRVVIRGDAAFVVVPDTDASGRTYRYGWVRGLETSGPIEWLGSFEQEVDDSAVFALANTEATITIAWDEFDRKTRQSFVRWAALDGRGLPITSATAQNSLPKRRGEHGWTLSSTSRDVDAEAPQLVAHRSGYWLAYLVSEVENLHAKRTRAGAFPKSRAGQASSDDEVRVVDFGRRGIALLALDANGQINGKPIVVTDRTAHVVTFDIEATADDGAIVAYRDADATPGVEERVIEVLRVRPDGGVGRHRIDDERVGAGMPVLLVDTSMGPAPTPRPSTWISVAGNAGETQLAELPEQGQPVLDLVEAPMLVGIEPMLRQGDGLLVARHRGRFVEFERMDCAFSNGRTSATKVP